MGGEITYEAFRDVLSSFGLDLSDNDFAALCLAYDENKDGSISLVEFNKCVECNFANERKRATSLINQPEMSADELWELQQRTWQAIREAEGMSPQPEDVASENQEANSGTVYDFSVAEDYVLEGNDAGINNSKRSQSRATIHRKPQLAMLPEDTEVDVSITERMIKKQQGKRQHTTSRQSLLSRCSSMSSTRSTSGKKRVGSACYTPRYTPLPLGSEPPYMDVTSRMSMVSSMSTKSIDKPADDGKKELETQPPRPPESPASSKLRNAHTRSRLLHTMMSYH